MARIVRLFKATLSVMETKISLVRVAVKAKILMRGGMILRCFQFRKSKTKFVNPKYEHNALQPPLLPDCLCKLDEQALFDISSITCRANKNQL